MLLVTVTNIHLPFVVASTVDVRVQLSSPEEDIDLGQHRYCARIDGPDLQDQLILPDHVSDPARQACLCTAILVNGTTMATSQKALQFPPTGRQFIVFQDFWRASLRRNAAEIRVGRFHITVRYNEAQLLVPEPRSSGAAAAATGKGDHGAKDNQQEGEEQERTVNEQLPDKKYDAEGKSHKGFMGEAEKGEKASVPNTGGKGAKENDDKDDDDDRPAAQRPPSATSRQEDKRSLHSMASRGSRGAHGGSRDTKGKNVAGEGEGDYEEGELPTEAQSVAVKEGLPSNMLREDSKMMDADEVAKMISNYDSLTHAIRKAAEELQLERQRRDDLAREHRRCQRMAAENNASMQVEMNTDTVPTVAQDELVTSYLKAADTYSVLVAEKRELAKSLTSVQNDLIQRRNEEAEMLTLREKHSTDCKNTHNLQSALRRAKQYRTLWSQQHKVIQELEKAILKLGPTALLRDTLLEGVRYQRLLAKNIGLQRSWVQANRNRKQQQREKKEKMNTEEEKKGEPSSSSWQAHASTAQGAKRREPTMEEAATLAALRERKRSLHAQLQSAKQKHKEETKQLQTKLGQLLKEEANM